MADEITLSWKRQTHLTSDEHLLDGYFDITVDGNSVRESFSNLSYAKMIGEFSNRARKHSGAGLSIARLEQRPSPVLMRISAEMASLLREDPVGYIRATNMPIRSVHLSTKSKDAAETVDVKEEFVKRSNRSVVLGGYDTLAESFGDDIYCRVSGALIECPSCGRWANFVQQDLDRKTADMHCSNCLFEDLFTLVIRSEGSWAVIPTEALLQNETGNSQRFFIPRVWNSGGPWIKARDLAERYESFCKERYDAF